MVESPGAYLSNAKTVPRAGKQQDIDAEVQQALSADIPLPPVEYLIAEERGQD